MRVVVAENPSVARELAKVLGANQRRDGYLEGNGWQVTWAIGPLTLLLGLTGFKLAFDLVTPLVRMLPHRSRTRVQCAMERIGAGDGANPCRPARRIATPATPSLS